MLFHVGALKRLNELGRLQKIDRISSVSGGSIVAGILGINWEGLDFDASGVAGKFDELVTAPVKAIANKTIDWPVVLAGLLLPGSSIGWHLTWAYRRNGFGALTLQDLPDDRLPDRPRFVINATNLQSGVLWRFSRPYMRDYRVGEVVEPMVPLAAVVAASSAFPPILSPARFRFSASQFSPETGKDLQRAPFTTRPTLADGGVYDNLGLQTVWDRYETVLVSDGGGMMAASEGALGKIKPWRWRDWGTQAARVTSVIDNQVRDLRKRQVIEGYRAGRPGTYWGIRSHLADYGLETSLDCPPADTLKLATTKTRLKKLPAVNQERLINWGYAVCDTAVRRWVCKDASAPTSFPFPEAGI
jgi:NTE family protein